MLSVLTRAASLLVKLPRSTYPFSTMVQNTNAISKPSDLLKSFGRSSETKLQVEDWKRLQNMTGLDMKKIGVGIRDRRYILWALEKIRQGEKPEDFAHEPKPKKKVRGWGPRVQNGKIIKSRRKRMRRN